MRGEEEALEGVAAGRHLAARALGGLGDQNVLVRLRLLLDQGARGGAADLLVRVDDDGHRQLGPTLVEHRFQGRQRDHRAALHIVDGGPVASVAVAPDRQLGGQRADRVDSVGMGDHQDAGTVAASRQAAAQYAAEPVAAGQLLDCEAERADALGDERLHAVDGGCIIGGAFDAHPLRELGQQGFGGEVGRFDHGRGLQQGMRATIARKARWRDSAAGRPAAISVTPGRGRASAPGLHPSSRRWRRSAATGVRRWRRARAHAWRPMHTTRRRR